MARIICKHNDKYNIYSTAWDNFLWRKGLSINDIRDFIRNTYGQQGIDELPGRLERVDKNGHSGFDDESLEDFLICNRCGENEECLPFDEIIEIFFSS